MVVGKVAKYVGDMCAVGVRMSCWNAWDEMNIMRSGKFGRESGVFKNGKEEEVIIVVAVIMDSLE